MATELLNRKILVTRPEGRAENLCHLIELAGGKSIHMPVYTIRPVSGSEDLHKKLAKLATYDLGIFVSQNAVNFTLQFLGKESHVLENLRLFSIGQTTANALRRAGFNTIMPKGNSFTSEALLESELLQSDRIKLKKIVIFRGKGGRGKLATELTDRGAVVEYLEIYERLSPAYNVKELENIWFRNIPDCVVVTSNEGLQNLFDMLSSKQQLILLKTPLVVLSERIAELAIKIGFRNSPVVADETSDTGLINAIIKTVGA